MRKIHFIIFLSLFITKSFPCSCDVIPTLEKSFKDADAVFIGTVISKKNITVKFESSNVQQIEYRLRRIKLFKGKKLTEIISITTGIGRGDCGYIFEVDKTYIVYANIRNQHFDRGEIVKPFLSTNICRRTAIYSSAHEKKLNELTKKQAKNR